MNTEHFELKKGAKRYRNWSLVNAEADLSTTASSVTWTSCNASIATVSNTDLASSVATFRVNGINPGETTIKGLVVFADGSEDYLLLKVTVTSLGC
jgi:uncharacterized protein YjdB